MKSKISLIIWFFCLLSVIIGIYIYNIPTEPKKKIMEQSSIQTGQIITTNEEVVSIWSKKVEVADSVIDDGNVWNIITEWNIEKCKEIKDALQKQYCMNQINLELAISEKDYKYCDLIRGTILKNNCKNELNSYFMNEWKCENINDINVKNICILDQSISKWIQITQKNCIQITQKNEKDKCNDYYYYTYVANDKTIKTNTYCDKILKNTDKNNCYQLVKSRLVVQNSQTETKIVVNGKILPEVEKECQNIIDTTSKNTCLQTEYSKVAVEKKDISYCDSISDTKAASECKNYYNGMDDLATFQLAKEKKDKTLCNKIVDIIAKEQCIAIISSLK